MEKLIVHRGCPICGVSLTSIVGANPHTGEDLKLELGKGYISICPECAQPIVILPGLGFREATPTEKAQIPKRPDYDQMRKWALEHRALYHAKYWG
jgi:hypothetical protein